MDTPEEHNSDQMEDQSASGESGIVPEDETPDEPEAPAEPADGEAAPADES